MTQRKTSKILAVIVTMLGAGTAPWWFMPLLGHFKSTQESAHPAQAPDPCPARTVAVPEQSIATSGGDAQVIAGDSEVNSDDWTRVEVTYGIEQADNDRSLRMTLTWFTQELKSNRSHGDTRIRSKKTFALYSVPSECLDLRIANALGLATSLTDSSNDYSGKVHGVVPYPDAGALRNVRVQFDHKGGDDDKVQSLSATVAPFRVQLVKVGQ